MRNHILLNVSLMFSLACSGPEAPSNHEAQAPVIDENPAAEGFNEIASDSAAIALADKVMRAMGGRAAWDALEEINWTFFGRRRLHWNKQSGDVDILFLDDSTEIHMNIHDMQGNVFLAGDPLLSPDSLTSWMAYGKSIWINDSYWLVMPFKLKDSGVTLKYSRKEKINDQIESHVLELTFDEVGDTPMNKYEVFIDVNSHLVNQWSYFADRTDTVPAFTNSWTDYTDHDGVLLSSYRGERALTDISASKGLGDSN